jgi:hypothetical protein
VIAVIRKVPILGRHRAHQDLLHDPTMWVTMSVIANLNFKSPFMRKSTTTPQGGPQQELQDGQVMRCPTMMRRFLQWCLPYHMPPPQRLIQDGLIATRSIPRLMIVTIKDIMNILNKLKNNRDKWYINLKASHIMVPHLW